MTDRTDFANITELTRGVGTLARDTAYVAVGLGVLGLQRAQVQRVELQKRLQALEVDVNLPELRTEVARQVKVIDALVEEAFRFVETSIEPIEDQLPDAARELARRAHEQARDVRSQLRGMVTPAA